MFYNEHSGDGTVDKFYRQVNETSPPWYLGINKDGTIRCGNVTKKDDDGATFSRNDANEKLKFSDPPEFRGKKGLKCCKKKRCKNRRKGGSRTSGESVKRTKKCNKYIKKCRKLRRKFFELTLQQLRKYSKNCLKERKRRHCKNKKKKS